MQQPTSHTPVPATGKPSSARAPLSVLPDNLGPADFPFLLGAREERTWRSLGASVGAHVVISGLAVLLVSLISGPGSTFEPNRENYSIVWIPQEGPGGGGGGGGNESLEMPREAELPGEDAVAVPVEPEPELEVPTEDEPPPPPEQNLRLSALPMASAEETLPGILEGLTALSMESQGPGVGGGAGSGDGSGIGPGEGDGLGPGQGGGVGGGPYRPGNGVESPRALRQVDPKYTAEAMRAHVTGVVWVEAVVLPDGTVGDVQITKSLDPVFGLDEEAVKAAKQWRFVPGTRFGQPVAVLVTIEISFNLR